MQYKEKFNFTAKFLLIIFFSFLIITNNSEAKHKKKKKRHKIVRIVNINIKKSQLLKEQQIADGLEYKQILMGNGKCWFNVHIAEFDLHNSKLKLFISKAGENINDLESLPTYVNDYNSTHQDSILISVNGNFWRAYSNSPIGPTIIDGEVLEINKHKNWSSFFVDSADVPFIDNFGISGSFVLNNRKYNINFIDKRYDSSGISYYNHFAGDTIPFIRTTATARALESAYNQWQIELSDMGEDSTENPFDTVSFMNTFKASEREKSIEQNLPKVLVKLLEPQAINKTFCGIVSKIKHSAIECPKNCVVVSFGKDLPDDVLPKINDTLKFTFETNSEQDHRFVLGVSGTPRIVRKGNAKQEAKEEGNFGKRFIYYQLPRTLLGYNANKTKMYFITIEGTNSKLKQYGANLNDLSKIAKYLKLYDAMNLDGGGSSTFIFEGKNLMRKYDPTSSRKISIIVGVKKK